MTKAKTTHAAEAAPVAPAIPFVEADVVAVAYDNEAMDGDSAICACTLTMADGRTAAGTAQRTDDLAADQAAAKAAAIGNL